MSGRVRWYSPEPLIRDLKRAYKKDKRLPIIIAASFIALILATLASFDFFGEDAGCKLADVPQSNPMQKAFYDGLMRTRFPEARAHQVSMVTISEGSEPLSVITNTCESRKFLAELVHQLDRLHARVIAVDQYFSEGACLDGPTNEHLQDVLEHASAPIVVGWGTHKRPDADEADNLCLILNRPFVFNRSPSGRAISAKENVSFGLIRLNENNLKVPLQWEVFPDDQTSETGEENATKSLDSFSFATAKLARPGVQFEKTLVRDVAEHEHPYSSFVRKLPTWSAMDVLCYGPDKVAKDRTDWGDCDAIDHHAFDKLAGQVVVVGSEIANEAKPFLGGQKYGAELHSNYIEALLDGHYVKTANVWVDRGAVVIFVLTMLFFQCLAVRELPAYKWLRDDTAVWISWVIFLLSIAVAFMFLELSGWFFPIFFTSCFPIAVSLCILSLYQFHAIPTKSYKEAEKGTR